MGGWLKWGLRFEVILSFRLKLTDRNFANHLPFSWFQTYPALDLFIFAPFLDSNRNENFSELFLQWADISLTTMPMGNPIGLFSVKWLAVHPWSNFETLHHVSNCALPLSSFSSFVATVIFCNSLPSSSMAFSASALIRKMKRNKKGLTKISSRAQIK